MDFNKLKKQNIKRIEKDEDNDDIVIEATLLDEATNSELDVDIKINPTHIFIKASQDENVSPVSIDFFDKEFAVYVWREPEEDDFTDKVNIPFPVEAIRKREVEVPVSEPSQEKSKETTAEARKFEELLKEKLISVRFENRKTLANYLHQTFDIPLPQDKDFYTQEDIALAGDVEYEDFVLTFDIEAGKSELDICYILDSSNSLYVTNIEYFNNEARDNKDNYLWLNKNIEKIAGKRFKDKKSLATYLHKKFNILEPMPEINDTEDNTPGKNMDCRITLPITKDQGFIEVYYLRDNSDYLYVTEVYCFDE